MVEVEQKIQTQNIDNVLEKYLLVMLAILLFSFISGGMNLVKDQIELL